MTWRLEEFLPIRCLRSAMHVTVESIVQYATLGTLVTGLVSLVVWVRIYRKQVNAQIVIQISARYAAMFQSFPPQVWLAELDSDRPLPERREEFTTCALQYASIVAFAYHLHERRYLTNDVWPILQCPTSWNRCQTFVCMRVERR